MSKDSSELFVAGDGTISLAPYGTPLPDSIADTLDPEFVDLGYLTTDGFRMTPDLSTVDIMGWQSGDPLRTIVESRIVTLSLDFLQSNQDVFTLYFGGGSFTGTVYSPPEPGEIDERSLVADVFDGTREWRFWFPKVTLTAAREIAFTRSAAATWGIDLKALAAPPAATMGADFADPEFYPGS